MLVQVLDKYVDRTTTFKENQRTLQLLMSIVRSHKPITVSGWVKKVISKAIISTGLFKAHSTRSASTSIAENCGTLSETLKRGNWSKESTWQNVYRKVIVKKRPFQNTVI